MYVSEKLQNYVKKQKKGLTVWDDGPINRSTPPDGDTEKRFEARIWKASEGRDYEGNFGCLFTLLI